jgi:hypothetical protein
LLLFLLSNDERSKRLASVNFTSSTMGTTALLGACVQLHNGDWEELEWAAVLWRESAVVLESPRSIEIKIDRIDRTLSEMSVVQKHDFCRDFQLFCVTRIQIHRALVISRMCRKTQKSPQDVSKEARRMEKARKICCCTIALCGQLLQSCGLFFNSAGKSHPASCLSDMHDVLDTHENELTTAVTATLVSVCGRHSS